MTTTPNEDAVPGGPVGSNTPKDGEGPESEREKGLDPTSDSSEGLNALHGANSGKFGEVVTGEELYGRACFASCSPMLPITLADRLEFGTALVIQGYPSSQAAMMANDLETNDGALQMLARHRAKWEVPLNALRAGPQFFAVAGLVETDLKERYESLRTSFDTTEARLRKVLDAVPENWAEAGAATPEDHAADLIGIAYSFMENLATVLAADGPFKGWHPADDPAEFVIDAANKLDEARTYTAEDRNRAWETVSAGFDMNASHLELVDMVAGALGLRKAPIAPSET